MSTYAVCSQWHTGSRDMGSVVRRWLALWLLPIAIACNRGERSSARADSNEAESRRALTPEIGAELRDELQAALRAKGPAYVPRTRHRGANGLPKYTNRLILETSPYLLQHAHNPVNWFPWGEEAFAIARATGRPVFLSVGYSTCHWCHVMEEESFEDEEIARTMNARYVCIKVDREERPDVDAVYMTAVQMLSGGGGWPMSVWLTPAKEPFFAGTYFPPRDGARGGRKGFLSLLVEQAEAFRSDPKVVLQQAAERSESIRRALAPQPAADLPGARELAAAARNAEARYDSENGGARGAPKFPSSFPVRLLLRQHARTGDARARDMALDTLRKMAAGGIYDHVGGGFHRYSVDARWLVPHFEKMLYDNALLGLAYLEGFQASGEERFARVARETLDYVLREMTAREGAFWSATDADSQAPSGKREEGYFFTWTRDELYAALAAERARAVEAYYAVSAAGNFEGRNVLHVPRPPEAVARELGISERELALRLADAVAQLRTVRARRPAPLLDDKIQASWNGLMLSALARGALVLGERRYADAAERAAAFITKELRKAGRLRHALTRGRTTSAAYLDDYTYLAAGLLDLFEVRAAPAWLDGAVELMDELERHYADPVHGGYFSTAADSERLLARDKPDYDGALPSGNSVALLTLLRLYELTGQERFRERAETTARAFSSGLAAAPASLSEMLLGVDFLQSTPLEIAVVLPEGAASADTAPGAPALLGVLGRSFVPNRVVVIASEADCQKRLGELVPWLRDKRAKAGRARAYVCVRGACDLPTSDPVVFRRQLERRRGPAGGERG